MTTVAAADAKRRALGKGLESLLPRVSHISPSAAGPEEETGRPREIPLDQIEVNPFQTRSQMNEEKLAELASSIAANGVVQPILVRPQPDGRFQLIAGERRWRASALAGKKTIPAFLRQVSDEQAMEITIVENLQRADLNAMEQARAFERLGTEFHMTQDQMSIRTGKDRPTISNYLRLLKLPKTVQEMIEGGQLTFGHAKVLMGLSHHPEIERVAQRVIGHTLSVRQTESLVHGLQFPAGAKKEPKPEPEIDPNVKEVAERLQRALGLKVTIEDKKGKGKVIIEYATLADFDTLLEQLAGD